MAARPSQCRSPSESQTRPRPAHLQTVDHRSSSGSLPSYRSRQVNLTEFAADPRLVAPSIRAVTDDLTHTQPRPWNRPGVAVGRPRKQSVGNLLFYGYPPELIARWCGVTAHTAYLYKIGARKPSKQALRLFVLHRDGRVLGPEWRDWAVRKNKLISPEGQESTQGQLNAYWLVMQLARELTKDNPRARDAFYRILAAG